MAEGYWVIRSYQAGMIGEKIKYWVPGKKPSKSERSSLWCMLHHFLLTL